MILKLAYMIRHWHSYSPPILKYMGYVLNMHFTITIHVHVQLHIHLTNQVPKDEYHMNTKDEHQGWTPRMNTIWIPRMNTKDEHQGWIPYEYQGWTPRMYTKDKHQGWIPRMKYQDEGWIPRMNTMWFWNWASTSIPDDNNIKPSSSSVSRVESCSPISSPLQIPILTIHSRWSKYVVIILCTSSSLRSTSPLKSKIKDSGIPDTTSTASAFNHQTASGNRWTDQVCQVWTWHCTCHVYSRPKKELTWISVLQYPSLKSQSWNIHSVSHEPNSEC